MCIRRILGPARHSFLIDLCAAVIVTVSSVALLCVGWFGGTCSDSYLRVCIPGVTVGWTGTDLGSIDRVTFDPQSTDGGRVKNPAMAGTLAAEDISARNEVVELAPAEEAPGWWIYLISVLVSVIVVGISEWIYRRYRRR
ncbi:hypothetical protein [Nocardia sp. NPDC004722]